MILLPHGFDVSLKHCIKLLNALLLKVLALLKNIFKYNNLSTHTQGTYSLFN